MHEKYIRFMAPVTPVSTDKLFQIVDASLRDGVEKIHLLLNSPGGSVSHGMAIYNFLKGLNIEIITYNFGTVDSIGVILYCAGEERVSVPHARFLLHLVNNTVQHAQLDEHNLAEISNAIKTDQENIAAIIGTTTEKTSNEILEKMHKRTTLNAEEAKRLGLVKTIDDTLMPANANFEVVREMEQHNQPIMPPFPIQLSAPPIGGETNLYSGFFGYSKAY